MRLGLNSFKYTCDNGSERGAKFLVTLFGFRWRLLAGDSVDVDYWSSWINTVVGDSRQAMENIVLYIKGGGGSVINW